jgi:hypothetical protein
LYLVINSLFVSILHCPFSFCYRTLLS